MTSRELVVAVKVKKTVAGLQTELRTLKDRELKMEKEKVSLGLCRAVFSTDKKWKTQFRTREMRKNKKMIGTS